MAAVTGRLEIIERRLLDQGFEPEQAKEIATRVDEYAKGCFGGEQWRTYFGKDVGNPELSDPFLSWCTQPDAFDVYNKRSSIRMNYETHYNPVWGPESVDGRPYTRTELRQLAANPIQGTAIEIEENQNYPTLETAPAPSGRWLVLRNEGVAERESLKDQEAYIQSVNDASGEEVGEIGSCLDLSTVAAVRLIAKKSRCFGDPERSEFAARFKEEVDYKGHLLSGYLILSSKRSPVDPHHSHPTLQLHADYFNGLTSVKPLKTFERA